MKMRLLTNWNLFWPQPRLTTFVPKASEFIKIFLLEKGQALVKLILAESVHDKNRFMRANMNRVRLIYEESSRGVTMPVRCTGLPNIENRLLMRAYSMDYLTMKLNDSNGLK